MADISKRLEKAEKLLQKQKSEEALEELLLALREEPRSDLARSKAADLSATLGHNAEAARLYAELFQQYASGGETQRAAAAYKKLSHLAVPSVDQMLRYAEMVERSNRTEAIQTLQTAVTELVHGAATKQALEAQRRLVALQPTEQNLAYEGELAAAIGEHAIAAATFLRAAAKATAENHSELTFRYLERGHQLDVRNAKVALEYAKALLARGQSQPALAVVAPFATMPEFQPLHARALLEGGRLAEAEPRVWAAYDADAKDLPAILDLIGRMVDAGDDEGALRLMHRVEARETQRKRRRDFIVAIKDLILGHPPRVELLRYLSELLNSANREQDYCDVLGRLFDLYYASGEFARAGDALDRAGEVDPYDPANQRRLDMLRGKLDAHRFHTVAARFGRLEQEGTEAVPVEESAEPTVLEDLMLQAEIFLRYNMRTRALERLERINRLFPKEEHNNAELRDLYERGSYVPESGQAPPPAKAASPAAAKAASPPGRRVARRCTTGRR